MWKNVKKIVDGNVTKFVFKPDDIAVIAVNDIRYRPAFAVTP
jgi:hypothetical protein